MKEKKTTQPSKHHKTYLLFKKSRAPKRAPPQELQNTRILTRLNSKKLLKPLVFVCVLSILLILPSTISLTSIKIKEIPLTGCLSESNKNYLQKEGKKIKNIVVGINTSALNTCIDSTKIKWHITQPSTATIQVTVHKPFLKINYLQLAQTPPNTTAISILNTPTKSKKTTYIDNTGREIIFEKNINAPAIQFFIGNESKFKSQWAKSIDDFFGQIKKQKFQIGIMQLTEFGTLRTRVNNEFDIIIDLNKSVEQQLSSLQVVRTQTTINTSRLGTIDLRFTNPILTFTQ